jgi:hypothetical protein
LYCIGLFLIKPKAVKPTFNSSKLLFLFLLGLAFFFIGFLLSGLLYRNQIEKQEQKKSGNFGSG